MAPDSLLESTETQTRTIGRVPLTAKLASQIVELVRREGLQTEAHLREEWLANQLRVSRSPVRKALDYLESVGVLRKERNRGFFLAESPANLNLAKVVPDVDDEEKIYSKIVNDQFNGEVGGVLTQVEIVRRYQLTARQALRVLTRMEKEDLISRKPGVGWEFHTMLTTVDALVQSYRFRMIIEPSAILEPTFQINAKAFAAHRRSLEALVNGEVDGPTPVTLHRIGSDFHEMIVGCSGNMYLLDALKRQNRLRRLMEYKNHPGVKRSMNQAREHLHLMDLLEAGDRNGAADFLRRHLDQVRVFKAEKIVQTPRTGE